MSGRDNVVDIGPGSEVRQAGVVFHPGQFNQRYYPQTREHKQIPAQCDIMPQSVTTARVMTLVSFLWWREEVKCDFLLFSLLFHVHLSQPLQSSERSGGGHVAWRPGPILSPVFQIMDGHNCPINIARPGVAATSQFSSRGLTHARHLGKEPRRSLRRSLRRSVQGMWDVRQPGSRGTRHCPGDRSQLSQDPGPAAGSQVADPGQTSARQRHGRMPAKICRQQLS